MLEYNATRPDVLFRVRLRGVDGTTDILNPDGSRDWLMVNGVDNLDQWRDAFEFKADRSYTNLQEIMSRMNEIATTVTNYIHDYGLVTGLAGIGPHYTDAYVLQPLIGNVEHLKITLTENGNISFKGSRAFWANFVIEVPERRYQQIFFDTDRQYVSLHPITGALNNPYTIVGGHLQTNAFRLTPAHVGTITAPTNAESHKYEGDANIMNTIDRRVTIEVSCSLPVKNSPMVDHGKESPDYALARYLFHRKYSLETGAAADLMRIATHDLGTKMLQGPRDRVTYHHLRPQQKIQTLRMRLWARVRTYNATTNVWGMKTIICPIKNSDFWYCRLHFKHHDS